MRNRQLNELYSEIVSYRSENEAEYHDKMIHKFPDTQVIDRDVFILAKCDGKVVLDIGCSGQLHQAMLKIAKKIWGLDKIKVDTPNFMQWDIDANNGQLPPMGEQPEIVLCGEVIEHLSNAGLFLESLRTFKCPIIITTVNAFSKIHPNHIKKGRENVNVDHVCYYSWKTMSNLLKRYNFKVDEFYWYDNPKQLAPQGFNEGIVFVVHHEA